MIITAGNKKVLLYAEAGANELLRLRIEEETAPGCLPKRLVDVVIKKDELELAIKNAEPLI